jgi:hypothetical protein
MKHRIKRANTARPHIVIFAYPPLAVVELLLEYRDELVWHYKNGRN